MLAYLSEFSSIAKAIKIFSYFSNCISINPTYNLHYGLRFERANLLLKDKQQDLRLKWKQIEFEYKEDINDDILFLKDSIQLTNFIEFKGEEIRK